MSRPSVFTILHFYKGVSPPLISVKLVSSAHLSMTSSMLAPVASGEWKVV